MADLWEELDKILQRRRASRDSEKTDVDRDSEDVARGQVKYDRPVQIRDWATYGAARAQRAHPETKLTDIDRDQLDKDIAAWAKYKVGY